MPPTIIPSSVTATFPVCFCCKTAEKTKIPLDKSGPCAIIQKLSDSATEFGGIAQLGERLNGIQEVSGSIPLISTTKSSKSFGF